MKRLNNQEALIYKFELTNSTRCFVQAEGHVLAIILFYNRQFLAGHSQVEHQPLLHSMTFSIHFTPRTQQAGTKIVPLLGCGTSGVIHHNKGATNL